MESRISRATAAAGLATGPYNAVLFHPGAHHTGLRYYVPVVRTSAGPTFNLDADSDLVTDRHPQNRKKSSASFFQKREIFVTAQAGQSFEKKGRQAVLF